MNNKHFVTPEGMSIYISKLSKLNLEKDDINKQIIEVTRGGSTINFSESAEYLNLSDELAKVSKKIEDITGKIGTAHVVDISKHKTLNDVEKTVVFGSTVHLSDDEGNDFVYKIVGEDESDVKNSKLSYLSPLGKNLIMLKVGDEVELNAPNGTKYFSVNNIEYV